MASDYPTALDTLGSMESHEDLGNAIEAVQAELGTTPSAAYDDVAARLTAIEEAVVAPPAQPAEITGEQGTDDTAILAALLVALDGLGLITDSTTTA